MFNLIFGIILIIIGIIISLLQIIKPPKYKPLIKIVIPTLFILTGLIEISLSVNSFLQTEKQKAVNRVYGELESKTILDPEKGIYPEFEIGLVSRDN
jgi:hypothetical protein